MKVFLVSGGNEPDQAYPIMHEAIRAAVERPAGSVAYLEVPLTNQSLLRLLNGSGGYATHMVWLADLEDGVWTVRKDISVKPMLKALVDNDDAEWRQMMLDSKYRKTFRRALADCQCVVAA